MYFYVQEWVSFLHRSEPLVGLPLFLGGAALILMGWRIWRFAAIASLALVGGVVGHMLTANTPYVLYGAAAGTLLFGAAGYVLRHLASTVLGAIIGGAVAAAMLNRIGILGPPQWIVAGIAFAGAGAWAFANRERVIAFITSIEGGILVVSGVMVMVTEWPMMHGYFRAMVARSAFIVPFFIVVPTVIGVMLQLADHARSYSKEVRG